jgi:hypothetical protein
VQFISGPPYTNYEGAFEVKEIEQKDMKGLKRITEDLKKYQSNPKNFDETVDVLKVLKDAEQKIPPKVKAELHSLLKKPKDKTNE